MADVTIHDAYREAQRELLQKRRNYPRWVQSGSYGMTERSAAHRLACQELIVATLAQLIEESEPQQSFL